MSQTHREVFGSRCTDTGGSSFVPVQIPPDFSLSHLLEEISTYFLKIREKKLFLDSLGWVVSYFSGELLS